MMISVRIEGETHGVHRIYSFSTFVPLSLYPVAVKVCEQSIDVVGTCRVSVPFSSIVS